MYGEVALITGGTGRIGPICASVFAKSAAMVVCTGRRVEEGRKTVAHTHESDGVASPFHVVARQNSDAVATVEPIHALLGRLDFAVNDTGIEGLSRVPTIVQSKEKITTR